MLIAFVDYCYVKVSGALCFDMQSKLPDAFKEKVRCERVRGEMGRREKTIKEMERQEREGDRDQEMKEKKEEQGEN